MSVILVVDDTVLCREAVSRLLEYEGFTVLRANHGRDAWALMYNQTPDLVLLDLIMPEMDGVTLLRMIRGSHRWHELPVIVLTGAADDLVLVENARELGIQDMVPNTTVAHYVEPLCGSGTLWHELGVSFSISTRLERGR